MVATPERVDSTTELQQRVEELMRPLDGAHGGALVLESIEAEAIPSPHHDLLVHNDGMTPTLEEHWGHALELRPLAVRHDGSTLSRQVLLFDPVLDRPVAFGSIRIHLDHFHEGLRAEIVASRTPLGTVLHREHIAHRGQYSGFFRVASGALASIGFDGGEAHDLYGRHNRLFTPAGALMAEIVEVLPPVERAGGGSEPRP